MEKIKLLMKTRVQASCKNLANSPIWNEPPTDPSPYIINLEKATISLHKILSNLLPKSQLQVHHYFLISDYLD